MKWKIASVVVAALVLAGGGGWAIESPPPDRRILVADYRRPAEIPYPESNPYSAAKAALGRRLFFDQAFSKAQTLSCASCHNPDLAWGDGRVRAHGESGVVLALRSPTLLNVAWTPKLGWIGKFRDLESVAFAPITSASNMNLPEDTLIARLAATPDYVDAFAGAFEDHAISRRNIEMALATFERGIVSGEAPFDRWVAGDERAIGEPAKRGFDLFNGKGRCASCHSGWAFSDASFHDIGVAQGSDIGRGKLFPTSVKLLYAFKTPTLRDVTRRAPYMHDGSVPTLDAAIELYNHGGIKRPSLSELIKPLGLTDAEKADLVAFLETLTSAPP